MIIIGEKINGTIPSVKNAIQNKDEKLIAELAVKQDEAGADYIDICAGTSPDVELDTLVWMMNIVQDVTNKPLCIDSPNPEVIDKVFKYAQRPGIVNSVSMEGNKSKIIYSLIQDSKWEVIALTCDNDGIPKDVDKRIVITEQLIEEADKYNISTEKIHLDPLVIAVSTDNQSMLKFMETAQCIKTKHPKIKITSGLSNISFGMPLRNVVNRAFLSLAMYAGMDSAILDPCNRDIMATLLATEALLGRDRHCRNFSNAYRSKKIGPTQQ